MSANKTPAYDHIRRTFHIYLGILLGIVIILGVLHGLFSDLGGGGVRWFDLDKERNIPTWFSGALFFIFGCSALIAYYWEQKRNIEGPVSFRLPMLWLGIGLAGLFMSLDEITVIHENLFWREIRQTTDRFDDSLKYVTQWQILFAPAIFLILGYFALFFSNRFRTSSSARYSACAGIGCWLFALLLEGLRETFRQASAGWYFFESLTEELMEMTGAIFLLAAVIFYTIDIALDLTPERRNRLGLGSRFFTRQAVMAVTATFLALSVSGGIILIFAQKQAATGVPVPRLFRRAVQARPEAGKKATRFELSRSKGSSYKVWFDDLGNTAPLATSGMETLLRAVGRSLSNRKNALEAIPLVFQKDVSPKIVFLSVSNGRSHAKITMGTGWGLKKAIEQALYNALQVIPESYHPLWLKLDIVQNVNPPEDISSGALLNFKMGLEGIAFEQSSGIALLPEELVAHILVDRVGKIQPNNLNGYLTKWRFGFKHLQILSLSSPLKIRRFTTTSFFYDKRQVVPLYRGHRQTIKIPRNKLLDMAQQGGAYLARSMNPAGRFVYIYRPKKNAVSPNYNIIRHAGAVYSMLDLYGMTGDPDLLKAAERAIEYLIRFVKPYEKEKYGAAGVVYKGKIKLGAVALAVVALVKYIEVTRDRKYFPVVNQLGRYIQLSQLEDGRFIAQRRYPGGEALDFASRYYPGEALFALVRLYALDRRNSWLDTAEKGANYLINVRDKDLSAKALIHDHWLLYALNELHRYRPNPLYLTHSLRIALAISKSQNRKPAFPDHLGSYFVPPRSASVATRTEGLTAAYQLARDFGHKKEAKSILKTIRLNVKFQLQTQFRPESVLYLRDPRRSLGAFHRGLTNFEIRIDYVQHNISALVGLYRILKPDGK